MPDWSQLAGPLAKLGPGAATILGTLIGGPAGGAIGKAAGQVLSDALGVPNEPEAVAEAIKADPDKASAAIASPDMQAAIAQAQADIIKTVNETYRIELQQESWVIKLARPVCIWCMAVIWTIHGLAIGYALWIRQFEIIRTIPDLTIFYSVMAAVAGAAVIGRTVEKKAGVSTVGAIGDAIGAVIKQVKK